MNALLIASILDSQEMGSYSAGYARDLIDELPDYETATYRASIINAQQRAALYYKRARQQMGLES